MPTWHTQEHTYTYIMLTHAVHTQAHASHLYHTHTWMNSVCLDRDMHAHKAISDETCATHILYPVSTDCVPAALCTIANAHLIPDIHRHTHVLSKLALEGWGWKGTKGSHLEPREVGLLHTAEQIGRVITHSWIRMWGYYI